MIVTCLKHLMKLKQKNGFCLEWRYSTEPHVSHVASRCLQLRSHVSHHVDLHDYALLHASDQKNTNKLVYRHEFVKTSNNLFFYFTKSTTILKTKIASLQNLFLIFAVRFCSSFYWTLLDIRIKWQNARIFIWIFVV